LIDLPILIISTTFLLGVALTLLGAIALLKKLGVAGKSSLKFAGIEISGANGAALLFLVGSVMILSGFGWASTHQQVAAKTAEVAAKTEEVQAKTVELTAATQEKTALAQDLAKVTQGYAEQRELNQALATQARPEVERLPEDLRARIHAPSVTISPMSRETLNRLGL
jgi:hypothetical protein